MSLASYTKARKAYLAGDETALDRMTAAVTPKVADKIGEIEHAAAEHRRQQAQAAAFAAEVAGQARRSARRARVRTVLYVTKMTGLVAFAAGAVVLLLGMLLGLIVHQSPASAYGESNSTYEQPLPAFTPDPSLPASFTASTGPGWVTLFVKGVREDVIHVSGLITLTDQAGNLYLVITPWGGQAYDMRLGGTTDYQFSAVKP